MKPKNDARILSIKNRNLLNIEKRNDELALTHLSLPKNSMRKYSSDLSRVNSTSFHAGVSKNESADSLKATGKQKIEKFVRFIEEKQLFEGKGRQQILVSPLDSVQRSYNQTAKGDTGFGLNKNNVMRSTFHHDSKRRHQISAMRLKSSASVQKPADTFHQLYKERLKVTRMEKLSNPFFQAKGYKLQFPVRREPTSAPNLKSSEKVPKITKRKETKPEEEETKYVDVDEDKVQVIISSPTKNRDGEVDSPSHLDPCTLLRIHRRNRIKTGQSMKKRIKMDKLFVRIDDKRTPEVKVRAKNRYPVQVPTPAELFRRDIEWKRKANPSAFEMEETCKKAESQKLQRQKETKYLQAQREFDTEYYMDNPFQ